MRKDSGSLLIVALVSVSVLTTLVIALAFWMRSQIALANRNDLLREGRRSCYQGAQYGCFERLVADTNSYDSLDEEWAEPYEKVSGDWIWRISASGWLNGDDSDRKGLVDEASRISINKAPLPLLAALLVQCDLEETEAYKLAARIIDWRDEDEMGPDQKTPERLYHALPESVWQPPNKDYRSIGELAAVPGMTPKIFQAIAPYLTVHPVERININTTSPTVIMAHFNAAGGRGHEAAEALFNRLKAFRHDGKHFDSTDPGRMGRQLGPLTTDESLLLSVLSTNISVRSDIFSGVIESVPAKGAATMARPPRASFTYDRTLNRFLHWVEE